MPLYDRRLVEPFIVDDQDVVDGHELLICSTKDFDVYGTIDSVQFIIHNPFDNHFGFELVEIDNIELDETAGLDEDDVIKLKNVLLKWNNDAVQDTVPDRIR